MKPFLDIGLVVERERVEFEVVCLDKVLEVDLTEAKALRAVGSGRWIGLFTNFEKKGVILVWLGGASDFAYVKLNSFSF